MDVVFFFSSRRRHTRSLCDWSSDVCSSDLNSSGHVGHNFCEHVMGPGVTGIVKELVGKPHTLDDGRPGGFYVPRFRNLTEKHPDFVRGYGFEGEGGMQMGPGQADNAPGLGKAWKQHVRDYAGAYISMGGFGE